MDKSDKLLIEILVGFVFVLLCAIAFGFALSVMQLNVEYLVYTISSDDPIRVDHMEVGYENGVLVATMMNGVNICLSPHEWKRVEKVLE